jgi:two-component system LytT family response regulator
LQAFEIISRQKIDILFLDINLPEINGIDFIRSLKSPPSVVFTTAYSEYASDSYELDAVDYLLKPVTPERFRVCMNKLFRIQGKQAAPELSEFLFIKDKGQLVKIFFKDIIYIEARKDYLMLYLTEKILITHMTMKAIEEVLPSDFIRIHRSFIVSKREITGFSPVFVTIRGKLIPIGRKYKSHFKNNL